MKKISCITILGWLAFAGLQPVAPAIGQGCTQTDRSRFTPASPAFIENKGQVYDQNFAPNPSVLYNLPLPGLTVSLKKNGFSYDAWTASEAHAHPLDGWMKTRHTDLPVTVTLKFHRVDVVFEGADPACFTEPSCPEADPFLYYTKGTPESGVRAMRFRKVFYRNLYPGIDLEFVAAPGTARPVEIIFT